MIKSYRDIWYVGARVQTHNASSLHFECVSFAVRLYERKQTEISMSMLFIFFVGWKFNQ